MKLMLVLALCICLAGCDDMTSPGTQPGGTKVSLLRQKADAQYEIQLRQQELDEMMKITHKPGVVGVSDAWLERKNDLTEKILQLKIKLHDLDIQIALSN